MCNWVDSLLFFVSTQYLQVSVVKDLHIYYGLALE